jgi:hypothetical protein
MAVGILFVGLASGANAALICTPDQTKTTVTPYQVCNPQIVATPQGYLNCAVEGNYQNKSADFAGQASCQEAVKYETVQNCHTEYTTVVTVVKKGVCREVCGNGTGGQGNSGCGGGR